MILLGTELVQRFEPVLLVFALVLLWSAYGLLFGEEDDDDDLSDNKVRGAVGCCVLAFPAGGSAGKRPAGVF